jgi:hypothetical protein
MTSFFFSIPVFLNSTNILSRLFTELLKVTAMPMKGNIILQMVSIHGMAF